MFFQGCTEGVKLVSAVHGWGASPGLWVSHWGLLQRGEDSSPPAAFQDAWLEPLWEEAGLGWGLQATVRPLCSRLENRLKQLVMPERTLLCKLIMQLVQLLFHLTVLPDSLSCRYLYCLCFTVLSRGVRWSQEKSGYLRPLHLLKLYKIL